MRTPRERFGHWIGTASDVLSRLMAEALMEACHTRSGWAQKKTKDFKIEWRFHGGQDGVLNQRLAVRRAKPVLTMTLKS